MSLLLVFARARIDEWESTVCVPISHFPVDIIRTNCPIFDSNLFLWWQFPTGVSDEEEMRRKKQHEDKKFYQERPVNVTAGTAFVYRMCK